MLPAVAGHRSPLIRSPLSPVPPAQATRGSKKHPAGSLPPGKNAPGSLRLQNHAAGNLPPGRNVVPNHLHPPQPPLPPFQRRPPSLPLRRLRPRPRRRRRR